MAEHSIVHIDIPATNTAAASKFYSDLFGWKIVVDEPSGYHMFQPTSGPGGGFVQDGTGNYKLGNVLLYISTDDIDASLAHVTELGGKVVKEKTEIPGMGYYAEFTDPDGNLMGLYTG